jgi:hypothetical protein
MFHELRLLLVLRGGEGALLYGRCGRRRLGSSSNRSKRILRWTASSFRGSALLFQSWRPVIQLPGPEFSPEVVAVRFLRGLQ